MLIAMNDRRYRFTFAHRPLHVRTETVRPSGSRAELRLGVSLPHSYKGFLAASDGFRHTGTDAERIVGVDEIIRLREADPTLVELWSWSPLDAWLAEALLLDDGSQGIYYLLDLVDVDGSDECAVWLFGNEEPHRYESFAALLEAERASFRDGENFSRVCCAHPRIAPRFAKSFAV